MWPKMKYLLSPEGAEGAGGNATTEVPAATTASPPAETVTPEPSQVTSATGKVIPLAQTTIDKIKREQLERGRKAAAADFEKKAKALGFGSAEEMFLSIEKRQRATKDQPPKKKPQQPGNPQPKKPETATAQPAGRNHRREDRQQREMQARLDRERRDRIRAQKRAEQAERDQWAAEAHGELKVIALGVGIKDPDYAAMLLTRECEQKRTSMENDEQYDAWLKSFDERSFFESLKKTRPALFQEEIRAATTGTTKTDDSPPPPGAGKIVESVANGAQKNVRGMSREDFQKELQRRGLTIPTT